MMRATHSQVTLGGVLRGLFLRDLGRKVVALVLAVGLWFLIARILRKDVERTLPLLVVASQSDLQFVLRQTESIVLELADDLMVLEPKPNTTPVVELLFSGPTTLLEAEGALNPKARYAIASDFCSGDAPRDFELDPQAVLINGFKPKPGILVRIKNAPRITLVRRRKASIRVDYQNFPVTGEPQAGWVLEDRASQVLPEMREVTLRGPTAEVQAVEADPRKLKFEPLRIKDLEGSFPLSVGLDKNEHPLLEIVEPTRIRVEVRLHELREMRTLTNVRVVPLNLEELLKESPKLKDLPAGQSPILPAVSDDRWKVQVTLSAPRTYWVTNRDADVLRDRIFLFVDLKSMIGGLKAKSLPVQFAGLRGAQNEPWPEEVQFRELKPDQIKVELYSQ